VVIERGEIRWTDFGEADGSAPAYRRPVVVVSADPFNASRIRTVLVAAISSNTVLAGAPGNVPLAAGTAGLGHDSVVNVSQVVTVDKQRLGEPVGRLPVELLDQLGDGLRLALDL
jgi:mRNA interferase MazF